MIKNKGPMIEPWGTPVVIGSAPDFTPFISTYCGKGGREGGEGGREEGEGTEGGEG